LALVLALVLVLVLGCWISARATDIMGVETGEGMETGEPIFLAGRFRNWAVGLAVGLPVSVVLGIVGVRDPVVASAVAVSLARLPFRFALESFRPVPLRLRPAVVVVAVVVGIVPPAAVPLLDSVGVDATDAFLARFVDLLALGVGCATVEGGAIDAIDTPEGIVNEPDTLINPPCGPPGPCTLLRCVARPPTEA
jgi:hypothetical protein